MPTEIANFSEIADDFHERVEDIVWCTVATMDRKDRPRSRLLHPVWEKPSSERPFGWILTNRTSHKAKHLEHNPYISLSYWDPKHKQAYIDAKATWQNDRVEMERVWREIASRPEPYGYDPTIVWSAGLEDQDWGVLELRPWRVELYELETMMAGGQPRVWRSESASA